MSVECWDFTDSTLPIAKRIVAGIVLIAFFPLLLAYSAIFLGVALVQLARVNARPKM